MCPIKFLRYVLNHNYSYSSRVSICMYTCFQFLSTFFLSYPSELINYRQFKYFLIFPVDITQFTDIWCSRLIPDRRINLSDLDVLLSCSLPVTWPPPRPTPKFYPCYHSFQYEGCCGYICGQFGIVGAIYYHRQNPIP